jgi:beta-glucanase (GH16 family)
MMTRLVAAQGMVIAIVMVAGCGSSPATTAVSAAGTPSITTSAALNGAVIVTLSDPGATIYYTLDGSTPTVNSTQYLAPFLVASNVTVKAVGEVAGKAAGPFASQAFAPNLASGTLVWSDEFSNSTGSNAAPNSITWTYDTGAGGWGNQELETYCSWGSNTSPCSASHPSVYVGTDGYLHIVAQQPANGVYTSARMKSQGLFSMPYGRIEARMQLPEGQGLWPAFWLMGNNIATVGWPACGEMDVMEHVNAPVPDWIAGSVHMPSGSLTLQFPGVTGQSFSAAGGAWHIYGMIWSKGMVPYYVDSPANVYASYTPASLTGQTGAVWPFDSGNSSFVILNLAVGGNFPGSPNGTATFPAEMLVDYVRVYTQ